jgi:hypothetical protein
VLRMQGSRVLHPATTDTPRQLVRRGSHSLSGELLASYTALTSLDLSYCVKVNRSGVHAFRTPIEHSAIRDKSVAVGHQPRLLYMPLDDFILDEAEACEAYGVRSSTQRGEGSPVWVSVCLCLLRRVKRSGSVRLLVAVVEVERGRGWLHAGGGEGHNVAEADSLDLVAVFLERQLIVAVVAALVVLSWCHLRDREKDHALLLSMQVQGSGSNVTWSRRCTLVGCCRHSVPVSLCDGHDSRAHRKSALGRTTMAR